MTTRDPRIDPHVGDVLLAFDFIIGSFVAIHVRDIRDRVVHYAKCVDGDDEAFSLSCRRTMYGWRRAWIVKYIMLEVCKLKNADAAARAEMQS